MSTRENVPAFAESSVYCSNPPAATQADGFAPGAIVPVQQLNELLRRLTGSVRTLYGGFSSPGYPTAAIMSYVGLPEASRWASDAVECRVLSDNRALEAWSTIWTNTPTGSINSWLDYYPDGDAVIVATSYTALANYAAINVADGSYKWGPFDLPDNTDYVSLVIFGTPEKLKLIYRADSVVYLATINRDTGVIESTAELTDLGSSIPQSFKVVDSDNGQFILLVNSVLYCYDMGGTLQWSTARTDCNCIVITPSYVFAAGSRVITDNIFRYNRADGTLSDSFNDLDADDENQSIAYDGHHLWVAGYNSTDTSIYARAVSVNSGALVIELDITAFAGETSAVIHCDGSCVYVTAGDIWAAYDIKSGQLLYTGTGGMLFADGLDVYISEGSPSYAWSRVRGPYIAQSMIGTSASSKSHRTNRSGVQRLMPVRG